MYIFTAFYQYVCLSVDKDSSQNDAPILTRFFAKWVAYRTGTDPIEIKGQGLCDAIFIFSSQISINFPSVELISMTPKQIGCRYIAWIYPW